MRELAAQVHPQFLEKELVDLFMDTLQNSYFERLVGSALSDFTHLVIIGEYIEGALKSEKI